MTDREEAEEWLRQTGAPEEYMNQMLSAIAHMKANMNQHPPASDDRKELLIQALEGRLMEFVLDELMAPIVVLTLTPLEQIELMRRIVADLGHIYDAMTLYLQPVEEKREDEA